MLTKRYRRLYVKGSFVKFSISAARGVECSHVNLSEDLSVNRDVYRNKVMRSDYVDIVNFLAPFLHFISWNIEPMYSYNIFHLYALMENL